MGMRQRRIIWRLCRVPICSPVLFLCIFSIFAITVLLSCASVPGAANESISLDDAIRISAENFEQNLGRANFDTSTLYAGSVLQQDEETGNDGPLQKAQGSGQKPVIAVLNFSSISGDLSAYVVDELTLVLEGSNRFVVVERQRLDIIRREENFHLSGAVSDESAKTIGKKLGAQYVITGELLEMGNSYRFRIMALDVETAVINAPTSININRNDSQVKYFMTKAAADAKVATKAKRKQRWHDFSYGFGNFFGGIGEFFGSFYEDYSVFNGLCLFGYTYAPDTPLGFSLGGAGVYTSLGFAAPDWSDGYKRYDYAGNIYRGPDYDTDSYTEQQYQIVDWTFGYNITIMPKILYLPVGMGFNFVKEWRLQYIGDNFYYRDISQDYMWNYPDGNKFRRSLIFETGLLLRIPTSLSPYLFGTYRHIGTGKNTFSIGGGISFDFYYD
jgi:TolB-like protein